MRKPFDINGVNIHYFGALALRSIAPNYYFGEDAQYIYVGSHNYNDVLWSTVEMQYVTTFFCNETPLDKRALFNASAFALDLIHNGEKNVVFLCDAGQHRSRLAAQLTALALGCDLEGVVSWGELTQVDVDFFVTLQNERFPNAMQLIADYLC